MSIRPATPLAFLALAGIAAALRAVPGVAADPPAARPGGQAAPADLSPVKKVVVEPSSDPSQPGLMKLTAEVDPRAVVVPHGSKTGPVFDFKGGKLTRSLELDGPLLDYWQKKYLADVRGARRRIAAKDRQVFHLSAAPAPEAAAPAEIQPRRQNALAPFQGLPELDPAQEERVIKNCIMITDLKVVNDPSRTTGGGPWTFASLMRQIANPAETSLSPERLVRDWLAHWEADQAINGNVSKARPAIKDVIIDPWPKLANGDLDLEKAPFRLLAIGSRLDLRSNQVLGFERIGGGGAGEARFVFCAVDLKKPDGNGQPLPLPFTVIFEYAVKRRDYAAVRDWALKWYGLKDLALGSAAYNQALQAITDEFAGADADPESTPNRSGLGQLRTNEIALKVPLWEVREFRLDVNNTGKFRQVTVKQNPDNAKFNGLIANGEGPGARAADLAAFVNLREGDILEQRHRTPVEFPTGQGFLGASAATPPNVFWTAPGISNPEARHLFSLGTCNACHAREAFPPVGTPAAPFDDVADPNQASRQPPHFTQVRPRLADKEAQLSAFLTGKDPAGQPYLLEDPLDPTVKRPFGDLPFRANDLRGIVDYGTYYEMYRLPTQKVH